MKTKSKIKKFIKKKRSCLMCGKMFLSNGAHNRRCPSCNKSVKLGIIAPLVYKVAYKGKIDFFDLDDV